MTIIPGRLELLPQAVVVKGRGPGVDERGVPHGCAMELWAWLRGLPWFDRPTCVDWRLAGLVRVINDRLDSFERSDFARRIAVVDLDLLAPEDCDRLLDRLDAGFPSRHAPSSAWPAYAKYVLEELGA